MARRDASAGARPRRAWVPLSRAAVVVDHAESDGDVSRMCVIMNKCHGATTHFSGAGPSNAASGPSGESATYS